MKIEIHANRNESYRSESKTLGLLLLYAASVSLYLSIRELPLLFCFSN